MKIEICHPVACQGKGGKKTSDFEPISGGEKGRSYRGRFCYENASPVGLKRFGGGKKKRVAEGGKGKAGNTNRVDDMT